MILIEVAIPLASSPKKYYLVWRIDGGQEETVNYHEGSLFDKSLNLLICRLNLY